MKMQTCALSANGTASASDRRISGSVTTTKSQSCMLHAEGAQSAHSSSSFTTSSGTGRSVHRRIVRRPRIARDTSIGGAAATTAAPLVGAATRPVASSASAVGAVMSLCKVTTGVRRRGGDAPWRRGRFRIPAGGGYLVTRYRRRLGTLPINYPALVERVNANLLDNAVRYSVPGGRVEISTRVEGDKAIVSIANTGPVIPPEQVHRLFDPFQRLDRTRVDDRHALGLSIVRAG